MLSPERPPKMYRFCPIAAAVCATLGLGVSPVHACCAHWLLLRSYSYNLLSIGVLHHSPPSSTSVKGMAINVDLFVGERQVGMPGLMLATKQVALPSNSRECVAAASHRQVTVLL